MEMSQGELFDWPAAIFQASTTTFLADLAMAHPPRKLGTCRSMAGAPTAPSRPPEKEVSIQSLSHVLGNLDTSFDCLVVYGKSLRCIQCDICGRRFARNEHLTRHRRTRKSHQDSYSGSLIVELLQTQTRNPSNVSTVI